MMNLNLNTVVNRVRDRVEQYRGTDLERKVKEATSSESWGVKSSIKEDIARATYDYSGYKEVMPIVWRRMSESGKNWRMVFKSLDLLDYLLKRGSERVIREARDRQYQIRTLRDFHFTGTDGRDLGAGVREKSIALCELLNSDDLLKKERKIASELHQRFAGINASDNSFGNNGLSSFDSGYGADPRYANSSGDADNSYDRRDIERRKKKKSKDKKRKKKKKKDLAYDVDRENEDSSSDSSLSDLSDEEHDHHRSKRHNKKKDKCSTSVTRKVKKVKKKGPKNKDEKKVSDKSAATLEPHPQADTHVPDLLGGTPVSSSAAASGSLDLFACTTPAADAASFFNGDSAPIVVSGAEDEWAFGSDFIGATSSPKSSSTPLSPLAVPSSTPASKPPSGSISAQRDDLIDFSAFSAAPPAQSIASTSASAIFDAFSPDFATADQALPDPLGLASSADSASASMANQPAKNSSVKSRPQRKPADACWDSNLVNLGNLSLGSGTSSSNVHPQIPLSHKPQFAHGFSSANASLYGLPQQQTQQPPQQTSALNLGDLSQNYQPSLGQQSSINFGFGDSSPMQQQQSQMQQAMFGGMSPNSQQGYGQQPQRSPSGGDGSPAYAWQGQENSYNF